MSCDREMWRVAGGGHTVGTVFDEIPGPTFDTLGFGHDDEIPFDFAPQTEEQRVKDREADVFDRGFRAGVEHALDRIIKDFPRLASSVKEVIFDGEVLEDDRDCDY